MANGGKLQVPEKTRAAKAADNAAPEPSPGGNEKTLTHETVNGKK
jgi:hypothetical protein